MTIIDAVSGRAALMLRLSIAAIGLGPAGCGEGPAPSPYGLPAQLEQTELAEVGEMYKLHIDDAKRPPRAVKDVLRYAAAFTYGSLALQEKRIVALWGVDLQPDSTEVLAYESKAPESGGAVLLRDGTTVKAMTAEEFQAAPKAGPLPAAKAGR
jgi:hypothetical protein